MKSIFSFFFISLSVILYAQEWETVALLPGNSPIKQIEYISDTEIYVSSQYYKMHRWNGTEWSSLGNFNPNYNGFFQYNSENEIYATHNDYINGNGTTEYNYIAAWNGTEWSNLGGFNTKEHIHKFKVVNPTEIYAVGDFDYIDNYRWKSVVEYNGGSWSVIGLGDTNAGTYSGNNSLWVNNENDIYSKRDGYSSGGVKKVKHWNGSEWTILSNLLDEIDGVDRIHVASANEIYTNTRNADNNLASIGYWDGTYWRILGDIQADMNTNDFHGSLDFAYISANEIYAVGSALRHTTTLKYQVARWDGTNWYALGDIDANKPTTTAFYKDGFLYVGGVFNETGKTLIKRFNTSSVLNVDGFSSTHKTMIFPNPVTSLCNLGKNYTSVFVYDSLGKLIKKLSNTSQIQFSNFNTGIYILKMIDEYGTSSVKKVLKE